MQLNPDKRITAADALKHPYFHSDPLPCDPSELPAFNDDFHEYTVRKDRKELQNKQVFERKNSSSSKPYGTQITDNMKQWPKPRGPHQPANHHVPAHPHHKPHAPDKPNNYYEKQPAEHPLAGIKRPHPVPSRPKLFDESLVSNLHPKPTPGLLSLVAGSEAPAAKAEEVGKPTSEKEAVHLLMQNLSNSRKRDKKEEYKSKGRGKHE